MEKLIRDFTDDYLLTVLPSDLPDGEILLFGTERGMLKCSELVEYKVNRKKFESISLRDGDKLVYAGRLCGSSTVEILLTDNKKKVRRDPIPVTGRRTYGVRAIKLPEGMLVTGLRKK